MTSPFRDDPLALEAPLRLHARVLERGEGVVTEGVGLLGAGQAAPDLLTLSERGLLDASSRRSVYAMWLWILIKLTLLQKVNWCLDPVTTQLVLKLLR